MKLGLIMVAADRARRSSARTDVNESWELACFFAPNFPLLAERWATQCIELAADAQRDREVS